MSRQRSTKQKKNSFAAGIVLLALLLSASCTQDEHPDHPISPGNNLYIASAIIAAGSRTETEAATRVTGDDVPVTVNTGSLGIFRSKGTGYTGTLNNKKYTYIDADKGWQPTTTADTLFLNGDDTEVCAYYPYNADNSYQNATAIPLYSGKYTGTSALHDPNDICYDINRTMNAAQRATTFEMRHALAMLEFKITKAAGYKGNCRITSIAIANSDLITGSFIDISSGTYDTAPTKGTIIYNPGTDADGILIESTPLTTAALLVPFIPTADGFTLSFVVNGMPVEANIGKARIAKVEAGYRYTVNLILKATSMQVTGVDMLPWEETGVGGEGYTWYPTKEDKVIDIGLPFVMAQGNLKATKQADNTYTYAFAEEQGYYSGDGGSGGDYFCWNTLDPTVISGNTGDWNNNSDPCSKVDKGQWYTPTRDQLQAIVDAGSVWGDNAYKMKDGSTKNGCYFGTTSVPTVPANQDKFLFLPAASYRVDNLWFPLFGTEGAYSSRTAGMDSAHPEIDGELCYGIDFQNNGYMEVISNWYRTNGMSVRCVRDKVIDIGLDFVIAPGNVKAIPQADGTYIYTFATEQGYYSGVNGNYTHSGGDYFPWNMPTPLFDGNKDAWNDANDPCRKIGNGQWYTPSAVQYQSMIDKGSVWGTYAMKDSSLKNGWYLGITTVPSETNQDKYIFLPVAGIRSTYNWKLVGTEADYWSSTSAGNGLDASSLTLTNTNCYITPENFINIGAPIRCIHDK